MTKQNWIYYYNGDGSKAYDTDLPTYDGSIKEAFDEAYSWVNDFSAPDWEGRTAIIEYYEADTFFEVKVHAKKPDNHPMR